MSSADMYNKMFSQDELNQSPLMGPPRSAMQQPVQNAYLNPAGYQSTSDVDWFSKGKMNPKDKDAADIFFGKERTPKKKDLSADLIRRANNGDLEALRSLIGQEALYSDGSLRDPMVADQHGVPTGHHQQPDYTQNPQGMMDESWERFKQSLLAFGGKKAGSGKGGSAKAAGADVNKTGTATDPTAAMDDDQSLKQLKDLIDSYENKDRRMDLSPLVALTDSWTGSNLMQGYDRPLGDSEREQIVLGLKGKLYQQEADLKYKKAYLTQTAEAEKLRQKFNEEESRLDRQSRERIAGMNNNTRMAIGAGRSEKDVLSLKNKYLSTNKKGLEQLARMAYKPKDKDDRSWQIGMGRLHDNIFTVGQMLEDEGRAEPGSGYGLAMELYKAELNKGK